MCPFYVSTSAIVKRCRLKNNFHFEYSVGQHGSAWHTAEAEVSTAYRAFSKEKVMADLGVNIGLNAVNVSLRALPVHNQSSSIDYNERFYWIGASQMKREYQNALVKVSEASRRSVMGMEKIPTILTIKKSEI